MSAARHAYGLPEGVVADERSRIGEVAILILGTVLSAAAIWFMLLPAVFESPASVQSCSVIAVDGGTTVRCEDGATLTTVVSKSEP